MSTDTGADELAEAGRAMEAFADGPARKAAERIEAAFARAGSVVRSELSHIARSGEADFERLARKLAQVLAEAAISNAFGGDGRSSAVNVVMNMAGGGAPGGVSSVSASQLAAAAARAVRRGMRFS